MPSTRRLPSLPRAWKATAVATRVTCARSYSWTKRPWTISRLVPGQIKENITTTGLDLSQVQPGQVFFIGDVTLEAVGECEPCGKMDAIRQGLREEINHRRGQLAVVLNGGAIKVGDTVRIEP